jgi:hypothetical protein
MPLIRFGCCGGGCATVGYCALSAGGGGGGGARLLPSLPFSLLSSSSGGGGGGAPFSASFAAFAFAQVVFAFSCAFAHALSPSAFFNRSSSSAVACAVSACSTSFSLHCSA